MNDTIVAIASGLVNQPVGIIRLSGPEAHQLTLQFFKGKKGASHTLTHGLIVDETGSTVDEVLVAWFHAPRSYTGENIAEINCHGGVIVLRRILELFLKAGARQAERGEFSRRAFLNGKIDLVKAEAIHDLVMASAPAEVQIAVRKFDGETAGLINHLIQDLLKIIATIEINIDYPEYDDIEQLTRDVLRPQLEVVKTRLVQIMRVSERARFLHEGIKVAILGRPNAGKSSLLNALLNEDKALVAASAGTTRDVVEGAVLINGVLFKFLDTAGIRNAARGVELKGIDRAKQVAREADLIIHVRDSTKGAHHADELIAELGKGKIYLPVWNKTDLAPRYEGINISAKNGDISALTTALHAMLPQVNLRDEHILTNSRQLALIAQAQAAVQEALLGLSQGHEPSTVIVDVTSAWNALSSILGRAEDTDLLDTMFKNFCLGK